MSNLVAKTVTGSSDVAYAVGGVPTNSNRDSWTSVTSKKNKSQNDTDKSVLNQKPTIAAKVATDVANQKQAANVAKNVVDDGIASKAAVAARDAVNKNDKTTKQTIYFGIAAVAALIAGGIYILKRKRKNA